MKRLLTGALALLLSVAASATTLNPIQLLNPTGSSSGQAIVSTGASSAPAWANVAATALAAQAANTVVANVTGSAASPTAIAMPLCNASTAALQYTTGGSGFVCNTSINAATLGGTTFAAPGPIGSTTASTGSFTTLAASSTVSGTGFSNYLASPPAIGSTAAGTGAFTTISASSTVSGTGFSTYLASPPAIGGTAPAAGSFTTLSATSTITPSQTAGIVGTTTNNSANAGSVGEVISSSVASPGVSLTSASPANVTSISLTAGDWDVWGNIYPVPAGSTVIAQERGTISTTTGSIGTYGDAGSFLQQITLTAGAANTMNVGPIRLSLASTTTVYLVTQESFSTSTCTAFGQIFARRRR